MYTKFTPEKRTAFLGALANTGNVTRAAQAAGMERTYMYVLRREDPEFAKDWDDAIPIGAAALEDEAVRRASEGWDEPVFYQGTQIGLVRKFSDTLLIFLLKARDPKFRDRNQVELTGKNGESLPVSSQTVYVIGAAEAKAVSEKLDAEV